VLIRPLAAADATAALAVTTRAIRKTEGAEYTTAQVEAWLSGMQADRFRRMLTETTAFGAFEDERLLGFVTLVEPGELDFLYVDPAAWRRGVARALVEAVEQRARAAGAGEVRVDASLLARPALEQLGYAVVSEYRKEVRGQSFDNAWLSKPL
jgi:GNAT superfamily N-acetyltransferase